MIQLTSFQSTYRKRLSKPLVICISALLLSSIVSLLATQPTTAAAASDPLQSGYWQSPVPADQGTGKVTQKILSNGVSGHIPEGVYGAYPSLDTTTGFDLTKTPILSVDLWADQVVEIHIIIVDQGNGVWNPKGWEVTSQYGKVARSDDNQHDIRLATTTSANPIHFEIDLRTAGIPLNHVGRISINFVAGMLFDTDYQVTNLSVKSATGSTSPTTTPENPQTDPTPTQTPTPQPAKPTYHWNSWWSTYNRYNFWSYRWR